MTSSLRTVLTCVVLPKSLCLICYTDISFFIITIYKRRLNYNIRLAYDEITFYFLSDKKDIQKETFPLHAITVDDKQPMRLYYVEREFWLEVPLHFVHKGEISKININLSSLKC